MKNILLLVVVLLILGGVFIGAKAMKNQKEMVPSQAIEPNSQTSGVSPTSSTAQAMGQQNPSDVEEIPLQISTPVNGSSVSTPNIVVRGTTAPNADVSVNDQDLKADANGNFTTSFLLDPGENIIDIVANNDQGNIAEKEVKVTLDDQAVTSQQ